jgi:hypothetical protein
VRGVLAVIALIVLVACGGRDETGSVNCSGADCAPSTTVLLPRLDAADGTMLSVRVCVGDRCEHAEVEATPDLDVRLPVAVEGRTAAVRVTVRDDRDRLVVRGEGVAPVRAVQLGSPECMPPCPQVRVRLVGDRLVPA